MPGPGSPESETLRRFRSFAASTLRRGVGAAPALDGIRVDERLATMLLSSWIDAAAATAGPDATAVREALVPILVRFRVGLRTTQPARHASGTPRSSKRRAVSAAIDRISEAFLAIDVDSGRIADANPAAGALLGKKRDTLLDSYVTQFLPQDAGHTWWTHLDAVAEGAEPRRFLSSLVDPSGAAIDETASGVADRAERLYSVPMSYERELQTALEAAREAGEIILRHYRGETESWEKSEDNPVTLADLESDEAIVARLRAAFPDDGLLSEESVSDPARAERRRVWIVDPMDGTKEFTKQIPEFAVSIALAEDGEPVLGVVHNPAADVTVWAAKGDGTFRDGRRVRVSSVGRLEEAVMIASRTEISRDKFREHRGWFGEIRPVGSIAWKLACIACGEGDLNISLAPKNEWDVCAGDVLVREAGGLYAAFDGSTRPYNQADPLIEAFMAAGPPQLVRAFCERENARSRGG
jgi:myo-inositol-1(or 4)-monophosphatase